MKTIEQLKTEQAAALIKLQNEIDIAGVCPILPDSVMSVRTGEKAWVTYKVKGILGALDVLREFAAVVPYSKAKNGCLYVSPVEIMEPENAELAEGAYGVALDVNQGTGFGPSAELIFWARLSAGIVRVRCDIEGPGYIGAYHSLGASQEVERGYRERIDRHYWNRNTEAGAMADSVTKWNTGSDNSARFTYRWSADYAEDQAGSELSHTIAQLTTLAEQLGESK